VGSPLPASAKDLLSISNIMFLLTGVYFVVIAALGEGSAYIAIGSVLCFVAVGLCTAGELFVVAPWRIATSAFCVLVLLAQVITNAASAQAASSEMVVSTLINGILFFLMVGVLLSTAKVLTVKEEALEEKEEEEELARKEKKKKKLTYEI
jgi:hypothetical protein